MTAILITKLLLLTIWIVYSLLEGYREAIFYYFAVSSSRKMIEMHPTFTFQRVLVFGGFAILLLLMSCTWVVSLLSFIGYACVFSFLHDGFYYVTRNKLDNSIYPKKWWDFSTTSTAKSDKFLTSVNRTILVIIGLGLIITTLFI